MRRPLLWLIALDGAVILLTVFVFSIARIDAASYIDQITALRHLSLSSPDQWAALRAFKPLYAVVGLALSFLSPESVLLFLNGLFLIGLSFTSYFFLREIGFDERMTFLGSFWITVGYPVLGMAFAYGTDASGWFFATATMLAVLVAVRTENNRLLLLASLIGFLGAASKETGVVGLLFGGVYLLLHYPEWGFVKTARRILFISIPFLIAESILFIAIHFSGLPTFLGWFALNQHLYQNVHTLKFFLGAEFATFNILWIPVLVGCWVLLRYRAEIARERWLLFVALAISALPVIEWPFFTDRILYSQFFIIVPLALIGAEWLLAHAHRWRTWLWVALFVLPFLASALFVHIGGHDGLYAFLHRLR